MEKWNERVRKTGQMGIFLVCIRGSESKCTMRLENKRHHLIPSERRKKRTQNLFRHPPGGERDSQALQNRGKTSTRWLRAADSSSLFVGHSENSQTRASHSKTTDPGLEIKVTNEPRSGFLLELPTYDSRSHIFTKCFRVGALFSDQVFLRRANGQENRSQIGAPALASFLNINISLQPHNANTPFQQHTLNKLVYRQYKRIITNMMALAIP